MAHTNGKDWRELCAAAVEEPDSDKLVSLVNQILQASEEKFEWQPGYGVVSFGTRNLDWILRYVARQKEHHRQGTTAERLERFTEEQDQAQLPRAQGPGLVR